MAQSKCGGCGSTSFEIRELTNLRTPTAGPSLFRFNAIQCASCGIVVGTHEWMHLGTVLTAIAQKLGVPLA